MAHNGKAVRTELAHIEYRQGRLFLVVADLYIAMQGDPIRYPRVFYAENRQDVWSREDLQHAADWINERARGGMECVARPRGMLSGETRASKRYSVQRTDPKRAVISAVECHLDPKSWPHLVTAEYGGAKSVLLAVATDGMPPDHTASAAVAERVAALLNEDEPENDG